MKITNSKLKNLNSGKRIIGYVFHYYKRLCILVMFFLVISSIAGASNSIFLQKISDDVITPAIINSSFDSVSSTFYILLITMIVIQTVGIIASIIVNQLVCVITQGLLDHLRIDMFNKMESLPIKYFDQNKRGDIMSTYTNDTDSIRQLISQVLPNVFTTVVTVITVFFIMLYYSLWLTILVCSSIIFIFLATKKIGGKSAKYFVKQQNSVASLEGYVEEIMNGEKVVKVFNHEEKAIEQFDYINDELNSVSYEANSNGNMLQPVIHNIGNLAYVLIAIVGTIFVIFNATNVGLSGVSTFTVASIGIVVSFLGMARQFANSFNQISQQINSAVMAFAGAKRIFALLDQEEEVDDGYVTLVNAKLDKDNNIIEVKERTGVWAWKHPHKESGTVTYTLLKGDIVLDDVDFGYNKNKIVLHNVSIFATPGQKIALVGSTGAGKTTITNLINRFYDIADGKVRYDGININKIKKADLRRSIGMVLQDTSLFSGTVRDNIKFGKLDATEKEVIEATKIANAYDFITRLPQGFDTYLKGDGNNLSQGQRQLLSIARAAISNSPVMVLDEATSSIDTRTELLVQKGMDQLMNGRTVFVIAHRLSTVQNSDAIMVLEHGKIIERGNHDSLIAKKGYYYQLYTGAFELE